MDDVTIGTVLAFGSFSTSVSEKILAATDPHGYKTAEDVKLPPPIGEEI